MPPSTGALTWRMCIEEEGLTLAEIKQNKYGEFMYQVDEAMYLLLFYIYDDMYNKRVKEYAEELYITCSKIKEEFKFLLNSNISQP